MKTLPAEGATMRRMVRWCAGERLTLGTLLDEDLVGCLGGHVRCRGRTAVTSRAFDR